MALTHVYQINVRLIWFFQNQLIKLGGGGGNLWQNPRKIHHENFFVLGPTSQRGKKLQQYPQKDLSWQSNQIL